MVGINFNYPMNEGYCLHCHSPVSGWFNLLLNGKGLTVMERLQRDFPLSMDMILSCDRIVMESVSRGNSGIPTFYQGYDGVLQLFLMGESGLEQYVQDLVDHVVLNYEMNVVEQGIHSVLKTPMALLSGYGKSGEVSVLIRAWFDTSFPILCTAFTYYLPGGGRIETQEHYNYAKEGLDNYIGQIMGVQSRNVNSRNRRRL